MTIDEAITHAREVADCCKSEISTFSNPEPYEIYCNGELEKCAEEHEQLVEWLEELKTLRYCKDKWNENQYQQGRADAIDEFKKKIEFEYKWLLDCKVFEPDVDIAFNTLISYAEQLKDKKND